MNGVYNEGYYKQYDVGVAKVDYEGSVYTKDFLTSVAAYIVRDLKPRTVLDAGCAMGYLVEALRDHGVEAYGVDISEYAISKVREDIKPYCVVGSLTEPLPDCLPQKYDLVVTIEVSEHLYEEDGKKAIQNLCTLSDRIIFSSTPDDFSEHTHFNVQQREYWAKLFAAEGFYDDLSYRPTYLTAYASSFRKSTDWVRQVEDYERNIRMAEAERARSEVGWHKVVDDKETHIQKLTSMLDASEKQWAAQAEQNRIEQEQLLEQYQAQRAADAQRLTEQEQLLEQHQTQLAVSTQKLTEQEKQIERYQIEREATVQLLTDQEQQLERYQVQQESGERLLTEARRQCDEVRKELAHYQEHYHAAIAQREELKQQLAQAQYAYDVISNASFWKITKPLRRMLDGIKSALRRNRYTNLFCRGLKCWRENGFVYTWNNIQDKLHHRQDFVHVSPPLFTKEELEQQRLDTFPRKIKFSVLVPLYNTPERFLHEMIRSVLDQTYENWELCLADGSDNQHRKVRKICRKYVRRDSRVKYRKLRQNGGISENTNACIEMASGEFFALLDHDDLLHPAALYESMKAICEHEADFVYTDENTFHNRPSDAYCPHFKPNYSPDTLRSYNYICHLTVFSRELLREAGGGFRAKFDGSQDYDMILRLTEKAARIEHIPEILYYWRSHETSVAADVAAKPYTITASKLALTEHLERVGLNGVVLDAQIPSTYRIAYEIKDAPLVSIIIPNKDHVDDLKKCIESIRTKTTYPNWEIVIVENNSEEQETFHYYEEFQGDKQIRVVFWKGQFNYSAINNFGAKYTQGKYLLLLNNDVEIITPAWIEEMLMFSQRSDVGAVGAMLYYPDNTVQHAGVILGVGGVGGHAHKYFQRGVYGYMSRMAIAQNYSAVTAACIMIRREVWDSVGGLDEGFQVAFNDVDLCMRIRQAGYLIVWTPYAELYHYESKSRGYEDTPEKQKRFVGEVTRFQTRWAKELAEGDPYYNPNLTLNREDFSLK